MPCRDGLIIGGCGVGRTIFFTGYIECLIVYLGAVGWVKRRNKGKKYENDEMGILAGQYLLAGLVSNAVFLFLLIALLPYTVYIIGAPAIGIFIGMEYVVKIPFGIGNFITYLISGFPNSLW